MTLAYPVVQQRPQRMEYVRLVLSTWKLRISSELMRPSDEVSKALQARAQFKSDHGYFWSASRLYASAREAAGSDARKRELRGLEGIALFNEAHKVLAHVTGGEPDFKTMYDFIHTAPVSEQTGHAQRLVNAAVGFREAALVLEKAGDWQGAADAREQEQETLIAVRGALYNNSEPGARALFDHADSALSECQSLMRRSHAYPY